MRPTYKHLPELLHKVRWSQHLASIIAEVLVLLAFFTSGLDIGLGGMLAVNPVVRWVWSWVFARGIDTLFIVSWVRVRTVGKSWNQLWAVPIALAMSVVVFQPVVVQLLQSSLEIDFKTAIAMLGFNVVALVFMRSLVSVVLGAVLALTNVETPQPEPEQQATPVAIEPQPDATTVQEVIPPSRQIPQLVRSNYQDVVTEAIKSNPKLSNVAIAKQLGISEVTGGRYRRKLNS